MQPFTSNGVVSKWVKKSWVGRKNPNKQNKQITNAGLRPLLGVYGIWSGRDLYCATPAVKWKVSRSKNKQGLLETCFKPDPHRCIHWKKKESKTYQIFFACFCENMLTQLFILDHILQSHITFSETILKRSDFNCTFWYTGNQC